MLRSKSTTDIALSETICCARLPAKELGRLFGLRREKKRSAGHCLPQALVFLLQILQAPGLPEVTYPFHDKDILVTACGRVCMH